MIRQLSWNRSDPRTKQMIGIVRSALRAWREARTTGDRYRALVEYSWAYNHASDLAYPLACALNMDHPVLDEIKRMQIEWMKMDGHGRKILGMKFGNVAMDNIEWMIEEYNRK